MKNLSVLTFLLLLLLFTRCNRGPEVGQQPNIILILADDLGHEVLGSYGGTSYRTPHIDKLAHTGTRFTNCYSAPKCAPSRVKIMTGRYAFRTTREWGYIPPEEITFGHLLDAAGYEVAIAGKWQMSLLQEDPDHIRKMGFAESCCFGWHEGPRYYDPFIYENGTIRTDVSDRYGPDVYCDFLIDFINRNRDKQFFAYYPMTLAHEISNDLETPPPAGPSGRYQSYREMVEYADTLVGRIIETLEQLNLRENTLILFTGDNGTPRRFITHIENGNYIDEPVFSTMGDSVIPGGKGLLTDGGTHVPLIANWTGTVPAGVVCDDLIDFSDFMPALVELTGAQLPENVMIDGSSFAPQLLGQTGTPREWIYQEHQGKAWVRTQRWKLYRDGRFYDVERDKYEQNPILPEQESESIRGIRAELLAVLDKLQ